MGKTEFAIPEQELRKQATEDGVTRLVIGVAIAKDGRLLIVRRIPDGFMGGNYELPGGGVDKQETILEGIKRETLEETGLEVIDVLSMHGGFDYQINQKKIRQFNFLVKTKGHDVTLEPLEHDAFSWITEEELDDYPISPSMKNSLRKIFEEIG